MLTGLFRQQAVEHQKDRLHGEVLVLPSVSHTLCTLVLLIWVSAVIAWLVNSKYTRKETVSGWLEPPSGLVRIYPQSHGGKVTQILVEAGQQVSKEQPLLVINGDRILTDGSSLEHNLLIEYQKQLQSFEQQHARMESIHSLQMTDMREQFDASKQTLLRLNEQIGTLETRLKLQQKRNDNFSKMSDKGHLSDIEMDNAQQQLLAIKSEHQSLLRDQVTREGSLQQLANKLKLAPQLFHNERAQIETRISELTQKINQLQGQRTHIIRAPRAGRVSNLQTRLGQQLVDNKPLLTLVPEEALIEAHLLVPVRAAGFLKEGQNLELRYDAFPYQKFGLYSGEIVSISDSVILPTELNSAPLNLAEPAYLVRAALHQQQVSGYGRKLALKSGMTLSADIQLSERTLLEWLLEPVYSLRGRL